MARNAIESEFWKSNMADGRRLPFCKKNPKKEKFRIDLKWPEMRSKVNFWHPKWPTPAILSKISKKIKILYWSKMARNTIGSEFWTSKMADGSHFVKISKKNKVAYRSEMARNAIESEFRTFKMSAGGHFVQMFGKKVSYWSEMARMPSKLVLNITKITIIQIMVLIWNGMKWFLDIQNGYRRPFKKKKNIYKKVERVIWTMFKQTAGRIQLDINSLLVNINTNRYVGNEGIYIVFTLKGECTQF